MMMLFFVSIGEQWLFMRTCASTDAVTCEHKPEFNSSIDKMTWVNPEELAFIYLFVDSFWLLLANGANLVFSVHCPAGCGRKDYIVYGTDEYRGVRGGYMSEMLGLIYFQWCVNVTVFLFLSFFWAGLKHLRRSHPRWCGAERAGRRLHPAENRRPGLLRRVHEARHHHTAVSPTRIWGVCALRSALDITSLLCTGLAETMLCPTRLQTGVSRITGTILEI